MVTPATRYVTVAIESLAEGDEVLARGEFDPDGEWTSFTVDRVFRRWTRHLRFLTVQGSDGTSQELVTTDEHPVYDPAVGDWVEAGTLHAGDQLCEAGGGIATVESTRREEHPGGVEVFNLRVAEAHTYLVRADGFDGEPVWVHNASNYDFGDELTPFGKDEINSQARDRVARDTRLLEIAGDPATPRSVKGWISNELRQIAAGKREYIRLPGTGSVRQIGGTEFGGNSGNVLAHWRGYEARDGFTYAFSDLQEVGIHKIQHSVEGYR